MQRLVYSKIGQVKFDVLPIHTRIYYLLDIAKSLDQLNKTELAYTTWQRAEKIAKGIEGLSYQFTVFQAALEFKRLDVAKKYIAKIEDDRDRFLDSLDLEIFKRTFANTGDRTCIANVPRQKLDFWVATDIGRAFAAAGDYQGAEKFVRELDIPHEENDPRTVGTWVFKDIARKFQEDGDLDNAKKYANKAIAIGGNLYYTGFGTKVLKRSICGELKNDLDELAQYAANHRGHRGRELVQSLIAELVRENLLDEAVRCAKHLEKQEDVDSVLMQVAIAYEKNKAHQKAISTADAIKDSPMKVATKIALAGELWNQEKWEMANSIFKTNLDSLEPFESFRSNRFIVSSLTNAYLAMNKKDEFEDLFAGANSSIEQATIVSHAIRALVKMQPGR